MTSSLSGPARGTSVLSCKLVEVSRKLRPLGGVSWFFYCRRRKPLGLCLAGSSSYAAAVELVSSTFSRGKA
ncbi:hypothetical protein L208DRAFT_1392790 [Tricholoma matsutake]|nr:hypothetical protein L208DRAFT_1392790 [Tricholoma matsutake 945]